MPDTRRVYRLLADNHRHFHNYTDPVLQMFRKEFAKEDMKGVTKDKLNEENWTNSTIIWGLLKRSQEKR